MCLFATTVYQLCLALVGASDVLWKVVTLGAYRSSLE
jgi:hypothetical protein